MLIAACVAATSAFAAMRENIEDLESEQTEQGAYVYRIPALEAKIESLAKAQKSLARHQAQILRLSGATDRNLREVKRYLRRQAGERVRPSLDNMPPYNMVDD